MLDLYNGEDIFVRVGHIRILVPDAVVDCPAGAHAPDAVRGVVGGGGGLLGLFQRTDHGYHDAVRPHVQDGLDDDGIVPGHPDDAGGAGGPAGHQMVLDILAVDGAVFAVDPDEVEAAAGDHLGDEGAVKAHVGPDGQLAGGHFVGDLVRIIHGKFLL